MLAAATSGLSGAVTAAAETAPTATVTGLPGTDGVFGVDAATAVGTYFVDTYTLHAFAYDLDIGIRTDLGTLGGRESYAVDVDGDVVVGGSFTHSDTHAFAYDLDAGTMTDIGTLGGAASYAEAVSGRTVVGASITTDFRWHSFAYDLDTEQMTDLGPVEVRDVDGDIVVGRLTTPNGRWHAFAHDLGTGATTDLGTLLGTEGNSEAHGVDGDTVVGWSSANGALHAFAYDLSDASMTDLGDPGGNGSAIAYGVSGDVVVGTSSGQTGAQRAFAYHLGTGATTLLPSLGGSRSSAQAVHADTVVGYATKAGDNAADGTVWRLADTAPPTVTAPTDLTTYTTDAAGATISYTAATATDDTDGTLPAACTPTSGSLFTPGETTVTCSATDTAGNTGTASFTVTVNSSSRALQDLDVTVAGTPSTKTRTSLLALLNGALQSLEQGENADAVQKLTALTKQVRAQSGKSLSDADAAALIRDIDKVISWVRASSP